MNRSISAFLYPFLAIVIWAGNVIVSKLSAHAIGPQAMTFYRLLVAVLLMTAFLGASAWRSRQVLSTYFGQFVVLGFLAMCLFQSLSYWAAETASATNMAVFTALIPLLTLAITTLFCNEVPTVGMLLGCVISLLGVVYLVNNGDPALLLRSGIHVGDLLMWVAALVYALYGVLIKRWHIPVSSWLSTYMQAICALCIMFPAFLATPVSQRSLNSHTLPLIGYAGALASVVLPFLWVRGVQILGPSRCVIFMNVLPVLTALGAILILHEAIHRYHIVGCVMVLLGVVCSDRLRRPVVATTARSECCDS